VNTRWKKRLAWLWVGLCTLSIFLIIPIARVIQKFVSDHFGLKFFIYFVIGVAGTVFFILIGRAFFRLKIRIVSQYIWLILCAGTYIYMTLDRWSSPVEAAHFLEYGLLGYLLFKAFRFSIPDKSIYFISFFAGSIVGIADEILQWMIPNRYWDIRDVGFNAFAVGLFQVTLWKGIRPKFSSSKISLRSFRIASALFTANLILLGLCLSNTPERVKAYSQRFPALAFLTRQEPMGEFKHKLADPEIGTFYSRLTKTQLRETDLLSSDAYAQVLREWKDRDYAEFLKNVHPPDYTFLYEMRIHIFRRDRKTAEAAAAAEAAKKSEARWISFKENLILEKYFGQTLQKSGYTWDASKTREMEALVDKSLPYASPVSRDILVWLTEKILWVFIIVIVGVLGFWNLIFSIRKKRIKSAPSSLSS